MASSKGRFNAVLFFAVLDGIRASRQMSWRAVAAEAGISPSTATRLGRGLRPDADNLVALLDWAKLTDIRRFTNPPGGPR